MGTLLNQIGVFLRSQEDRAGALAAQRAGLDLAKTQYADTDREFPLALGNLAVDLSRAGEFGEAEALLDRALHLDARDRGGSADHAGVLRQRANLEFRRREAGAKADRPADLAAALAWLKQAREIETALAQGGPSEALARTWNEIGYLHRLAGREVEMADAAETAYRTLREMPEVNRAALATFVMNAGAARLEAGQAEVAEGPLREAWEIREEIYRDTPGHSQRRTVADWLAACLLVLDRKQGGTARQAEAREIAGAVELDWDELVATAAQYRLEPPDREGARD
jgi:tetratricopeptide (TPR) repeat protein